MMSSARVVVVPLAQELGPLELRAELLRALGTGSRLVTWFGRPNGAGVILTAVLEREGRASVLRTVLARGERWHSMVEEAPALHVFERELHEQLGVDVRGHPWLKPVRYEGAPYRARDGYPFYSIEGKEVHEVAVGPIHAGVIEPGSFRFMCHGEEVHHLEIHHGYQHRGAERLLLRGDPRRLAPLVETIVGDASVAHTWAYAAAIEALAEHMPAAGIDEARAVLLELERIAMHLGTLSGMASDIGFLQGSATYGRLRTTAINTTMRACGSRFGRGAVRPGGLGLSAAPLGFEELAKSLALLREDGALIDERFVTSWTVDHRLRGTGVLTPERARSIGCVGVVARASGVAVDVRGGGPGLYARRPIPMVVDEEGDCAARARVRCGEIRASLGWLSEWLASDPAPFVASRAKLGALAPSRLVVTQVESSRGEVVHALETGPDGGLVHYRVQDPSLRNWLGLALAVRGNEISDFPICNKSFDLSYCGTDL